MSTPYKTPYTFATIFLLMATRWCLAEQAWTQLPSPAGGFTISVSISEKGRPRYRVQRAGKDLIMPSGLGFELGGGADATAGFGLPEITLPSEHDSVWEPVWGERSSVRNHYNTANARFSHKDRRLALTLEMRAFDEGVAFRYLIDALEGGRREIEIKSEMTEFRFTADHDIWAVTSAQGKYSKMKLSETQHRGSSGPACWRRRTAR